MSKSRKSSLKLTILGRWVLITSVIIGIGIWLALYLGTVGRNPQASRGNSRPQLGLGIAHQATQYTQADIDQLGQDFWIYDWVAGKRANQPLDLHQTYGDRYVPMQWRCNTKAFEDWMSKNPNYAGPMLIFNEPDDPHQANCSPQKGAEVIKQIIDIKKNKGYQTKLIVAGVLQGPKWIEQMGSEYKRMYGDYPSIDGIHFHIYAFPHEFDNDYHNVDKIVTAMTRKLNTWDKWLDNSDNAWASNGEVWITEYGWLYSHKNSNHTEINQVMTRFTERLMQNHRLDRVAWFVLQYTNAWNGTSLVSTDGNRTVLWQGFKSLCTRFCGTQTTKPQPTNTPAPTRTPTPRVATQPTATPTPQPQPTTTQTAGNLISNGTFSSGQSNWQFYSNGSASFNITNDQTAQITLTTTGSNTQLYQSGFSIANGRQYTLRFRAMADKNTPLGLYIHRHGRSYESAGLDEDPIQIGTTWKNYEYKFSSNIAISDARIRFWFVPSTKPNTIQIDNITLVQTGNSPISTPTITPNQPATPTPTSAQVTNTNNRIQNGSFESRSQSWNFFSDSQASFGIGRSGHLGNNQAIVQVTQPGSNVQLYQYGLTINPKTRYRLEFYAKANRQVSIGALIHRHASPYDSLGLNQNNITITTSWKKYTFDFNATNTNKETNARLRLWLVSLTKGDMIEFDGISLIQI